MPITKPVEADLPAKFVAPGGTTMPVTGKPMGRRDFQALISADKAGLISRQHILVTYENSQYSIEDFNSTNGTKLNGSEIRGTGKHTITGGDTVELAGTLNLTFQV
jgi:pSer/pThr/pTyr-binding forkhead associated (FHA) protein